MCLKAINIAGSKELCFRILALILADETERRRKWVKYNEIAELLNREAEGTGETVSEEVVRYNIRKLVRLGYLRSKGKDGYEPTERVLFIDRDDPTVSRAQ